MFKSNFLKFTSFEIVSEKSNISKINSKQNNIVLRSGVIDVTIYLTSGWIIFTTLTEVIPHIIEKCKQILPCILNGSSV